MVKRLLFELDDDTYFRLKELKARKKAATWTDFIEKILEDYGL